MNLIYKVLFATALVVFLAGLFGALPLYTAMAILFVLAVFSAGVTIGHVIK